MSTLDRNTVQHTATVSAPARLVFDLVAGLSDWSQFHEPAVHAETIDRHDASERVRHWWVVDDDTVRTWDAGWRFDPERLIIDYQTAPGASGPRGRWTFRAVGDTMTEVVLTHEACADGLEGLLPSVAAAAELAEQRADLVVDFEDTLFSAGELDDAYAYLYEANRWPERIPHVSRLVLQEDVPNIQFFDMDTQTSDGAAHTTRSVRICRPPTKIVYKQIHLPKLLAGHTGHWRFTPTREGFIMGARHTAIIKPETLAILGPDTTVLDARRYLRRVLGANSMGNLRLAKAYAEERAGV